jgi:hypothetical protein
MDRQGTGVRIARHVHFLPWFRVTGQQHARRTVGEGTPILEIIDSCRKSVVAASQKTKQAAEKPPTKGRWRAEKASGEARRRADKPNEGRRADKRRPLGRSVLKCARSALEPGLSVGTVCAQKTPDVDHV